MGPSTVAAMNVGMVLGWAFLSPLSMRMGWATGEIGGAKGAKAWILWPALAILLAESLVSIATVGFTTLANTGNGFEADEEPQDEPSTSLVVGGVIGSSILCVVLIAYLFGSDGIRWWATVIAIVLGGAFSILGVRALGETDLNPYVPLVPTCADVQRLCHRQDLAGYFCHRTAPQRRCELDRRRNRRGGREPGGRPDAGPQDRAPARCIAARAILRPGAPTPSRLAALTIRSSSAASHRCLSRPGFTSCIDECTTSRRRPSPFLLQPSGTPAVRLARSPLILSTG